MTRNTGTENPKIPCEPASRLLRRGLCKNESLIRFGPQFERIRITLLFACFSVFALSPPLRAEGLFFKKRSSPSSSRFQKPSGKFIAKYRKKTSTASVPSRSGTGFRSRASSGSISSKSAAPVRSFPADPLAKIERSNPDTIRIFVLGDSQSQTEFGPEFREQLLGYGYEVLFHAVKNGTPYFWSGDWKSSVLTRVYNPASTPDSGEDATPWQDHSLRPRSLGQYVDAYDPDVFVIQAGTNFERDLIDGNAKRMSARITKCLAEAQKNGTRILWVGPPDARDDVKSPESQIHATETLRSILAPISEKQGLDSFFDSRPVCPMSNSTRGDGEHPTISNAIAWAKETAEWVAGSVSDMECDRILRSGNTGSPPPKVTSPDLFGPVDTDLTIESHETHLRLVAKSTLPDIQTFEYTNAFAVYLYTLGECENSADSLGLTNCKYSNLAETHSEFPAVYVLHWAYHNRGEGSPLTPIHEREEGRMYQMNLVPLEKHPLKDVMSTMAQFNDFNDFNAPLFVAANVMEESAP